LVNTKSCGCRKESMSYEMIDTDRDQGVGIITLSRPEVLNALNFQMVSELDQAITEMEEDDGIRAIVLTGAGDRAFSAGADIHEQKAAAQELSREELAGRLGTRAEFSWHVGACVKPTIGAMNGLAYGGGGVLATSLDIRIGCERTIFRFLAAAYGRLNTTWTLPIIVGVPMAKELLFSGREVSAEEAYRIGLLNHLVPVGRVMDKAMELAVAIAKNRPESVKGIKELLLKGVGGTWREMWQREDEMVSSMEAWPVERSFSDFLARKGR
jgi:enoyl-CoA hydratase/carnithine racemase